MKSLVDIANALPAIDLAGLSAVDFNDRVDTKYIFPAHLIPKLMEKIGHELLVLEVGANRLFDYKNIYYDTSNFEFFQRHHAGHLNRIKIRARQYSEKGPFMLEVKTKTNKDKTLKVRHTLDSLDQVESNSSNEFLIDQVGYGFDHLPERTWVNYSRLTFANKSHTEKFTLDTGLLGIRGDQTHDFSNLAIAEIKQEKFSYSSLFVQALKELKIQPKGFSKYCSCLMHLEPALKQNRFKTIRTKLKKIEAHGTAA